MFAAAFRPPSLSFAFCRGGSLDPFFCLRLSWHSHSWLCASPSKLRLTKPQLPHSSLSPRSLCAGSVRGFPMNPESVSMLREVPMAVDIRGMAPLLQVFDMPTSIKSYRDALGFEVVTTSTPRGEHFDWALLRLNGVELMLNTAYEEDARPPAPDPARLAVHEDTCLYFGCPDVDAAYAYLRTRGVAAKEPKIAPYGMKQLYVSDPDGYNLCFQWPAK